MTTVCFIPARSGSQRIPGKNVKLLGGKPLLAWAIEAARESKTFDEVYVSSDSPGYLAVANEYGAGAIEVHAEFAVGDEMYHAIIRAPRRTKRQTRFLLDALKALV